MPRIDHLLKIKSDEANVFEALTSTKGLNSWWTLKSIGVPIFKTVYNFHFDAAYDWFAEVSDITPNELVEWTFTNADEDWTGTVLRIELSSNGEETFVSLSHLGWRDRNDHFKRSSYCWAMYLKCLQDYLEKGIITPYDKRGGG